MRWAMVLAFFFVSGFASAQKIGDGLWNTGRVFSAVPAKYADSLVLQKLVARINLYPGFAVVRTDLDLQNPGKDRLETPLLWVDSTTTLHSEFTRIGNLPSADRVLIINNDTVATDSPVEFGPGVTSITVFEITPNQQALISRSGSVKEGNSFVYTIQQAPWKKKVVEQVFVQLAGDMTLTNIMGIYPPAQVTTTMSQIKWIPESVNANAEEQSLILWYQGAAPDMKLEKKVLPAKSFLYKELNNLNLSLFDTPSFVQTDKKDFSTNKKSPFFSFLYFLMFSAPWILLVAFLVWLVFKPKKKNKS